MISRFGSLLLLLYALGFVLFAFTLGRPAAGLRADRCRDRADRRPWPHRACDRCLQGGQGPATADRGRRSVGHQDGSRPAYSGRRQWLSCCVDLGSESVDTRSNAEEASRWLARHQYRSLRLITSDWHMRRAHYEFARVFAGSIAWSTDGVRTEPSFLTLFGEYNKYLLRRLAVWVDL